MSLALCGALLLTALSPLPEVASAAIRNDAGCRITRVIDGDTVAVRCPATGADRLRLAGVDTPELSGRCASERLRAQMATQRVRWLVITAGEVRVLPSGRRDRYGRLLGRVLVDGRPLGAGLVGAGHARPYAGGRRWSWCG